MQQETLIKIPIQCRLWHSHRLNDLTHALQNGHKFLELVTEGLPYILAGFQAVYTVRDYEEYVYPLQKFHSVVIDTYVMIININY